MKDKKIVSIKKSTISSFGKPSVYQLNLEADVIQNKYEKKLGFKEVSRISKTGEGFSFVERTLVKKKKAK